MIAGKITSFIMMLVIGALLILSVLISTLLTTTKNLTVSFTGDNRGSQFFWYVANSAGSLCIVFLGILLLYRLVPRREIVVRDVWRAALGAGILWEAAKEAFALFLGSSFANYSAVYGTLGTVIALLTWIYVSSIIILTGAEFAAETARVRRLRNNVAGVNQSSDKSQGRRSPWFAG